LFFSISKVKNKFHHFWRPPGKNFGKISYWPPWKKILPTHISVRVRFEGIPRWKEFEEN